MGKIVKRFLAKIRNGEYYFHGFDGENYRNRLKRMEGKWVWVTIERVGRQRTLNQNAYYWAVPVKMLSEFWGYETDEVHVILRKEFLRIPGEGGKPDRIGSTRDLTTITWEKYMEKIRRWAAIKWDLYIPEPHEVEISGEVFK